MKRKRALFLTFAFLLGFPLAAWSEPTDLQLSDAVRKYVVSREKGQETFKIFDALEGRERVLTFESLEGKSGLLGPHYYFSVIGKDAVNGALLTLDFILSAYNGNLEVKDVLIREEGGSPRYFYDASGNILPAQS